MSENQSFDSIVHPSCLLCPEEFMTAIESEYGFAPAELAPTEPRGLRAGLLLLALTAVLAVLAWLPAFLATESLGILGTLAVLLALRFKYRGRIPLNIETCFQAGICIQYLFAPALIRLISGNFTATYWRENGTRVQVKDYYGPAMLVVLLFCAVALLTTGFFRGPITRKLIRGKIAVVFTRRSFYLLIVMIFNLWTARAALLAAGAFYHVSHTKFVESDAYSALAQAESGLGKIAIAYLWTGVFASGYALMLAVPYTILDVGWNFVAGNREPIVIAVIIICLTSYICRNRIPWKFMVIVTIPMLILLGFMQSFRYTAQKMANDRIDMGAIVAAVKNAVHADEETGGASFLVTAITRFNDLDSIAVIYTFTPDAQSYLYGETWGRIPDAMVPRQFSKDKKTVIIPINEWFFRHDGGTSPLTAPGEGYLNFGWFGVVVEAVACGLMVRTIEWVFSLILWNGSILPIYIATLAIFARMHTQPMTIWTTAVVKTIMFVTVLHWLTRPSRETYYELLASDQIPAGDAQSLPALEI